MTVTPAKTAELIVMHFGMLTWVDQGTVLDGVQILPMQRDNFEGGKWRPIV